MRDRKPGLKEGNLETHVDSLIGLHFEQNKLDIFKRKALLEALMQLCVCSENGVVNESEKTKRLLSKDEFDGYSQIYEPLLNPRQWFQSLNLTKSDEPEVRYAIQKKLFELICEELRSLGKAQKYGD